jgi:NADH-quinone oxidoreductase subunit N
MTAAMGLLLAAVWRPQGNVRGSAEGAERTSAITRLSMVACLITAIVVIIAWGDGAAGTPDQRIAGDGFRWAVDLIVLVGTGLSLVLLEADHARNGAYSPEVPVLMLLPHQA